MAHILEGLVLVNGTDIWTEYGVFLTEEKPGGRENLDSILTPSKVKGHVGVDFRERNGKKYSAILDVKNEERDVTLTFALYAPSRAAWFTRYGEFIRFLKAGDGGWLDISFPTINVTLHVYYLQCGGFKSLSYLWGEGVHAGRFKVTFREPVPSI